MRTLGRFATAAAVLVLSTGAARAQGLPVPKPGETPVCGVHFYGPCLPEEKAPEPKVTLTAPPADLNTRSSFDEFAFAGDDPLTRAILTAEAGAEPTASRVEAKTIVDPTYKGLEAPEPAPIRMAASRGYKAIAEDDPVEHGEAEPPIGWRYAPQGTRLDPVQTVASADRIVRGVVGRKTGTSQLNFVSINTPGVEGRRGPEDAANWLSAVWDGIQQKALTEDLEVHARDHNFIRERGVSE